MIINNGKKNYNLASHNVKISFIIASVARDQELQQCIASIEHAYEYSRDVSIEILVVIQNNKQEKDLCICYPGLTKIYYIDEIGLSVARNFAIKKSVGEYFIFLDDDAMVKEDFLLKIKELLLEHNDVSAFGGCLFDQSRNTPFSSCYALNAKKVLGWADFQLFRGSAIILKRDLQQKIGFFDECFGSGARFYGAEDSDIFFRIKQAGEKIIYLPNVIFYHNILVKPPASKVFHYSYAVGAMFMKQIFNDPLRFYLYSWILFNILGRNFVRLLQVAFFPALLRQKDIQFHYGAAFPGMIAGLLGFMIRGKSSREYAV